MTRKRLGQFATVASAASLALMLIGVGAASANPPKWSMSVVTALPTVSSGKDEGYTVTITNAGPSNIATLFLVSDQTASPSFVGTPSQGTCNPVGGPLDCAFGALNANQSVSVLVAYTTPGTGTSFAVTFQANTTGATFSDSKGTSHGDTLSKTATIGLSSSKDFGGGFIVGSNTIQDYLTVGRNNPQSTSVDSPASLIPVTVQDGITTGIPCTIAACAHQIGEWSTLNVNGGATFGTAFPVTLMIWGGAVPGGVSTSDIFVLHTLDNGTTVEINTPCTPTTGTPTNPECLTVTKVGNNYKIVVWVFENGSMRGGI